MSVYEEVEIEDMEWEADEKRFTYPCPCGDRFVITLVRGGKEEGLITRGRSNFHSIPHKYTVR